jgi:glycosyltransferase involved in cell wall biosynthesis
MPEVEVSIVIPSRNEAGSIGAVIDEIHKALTGRGYEILVVDTESTDGTVDIARAKGARVVPEPRRGYGRAYKTGFAEARGKYVATLDADLTYPADRIPEFVGLLDGGTDFVSGDRLSNLKPGAMTGMHRIGNSMLNMAFRFVTGHRIRDSQSGMWVFRRSILQRLTLVDDGMPFSEELKMETIRAGLRFVEVPIDYRPRVGEKKLRSFSDAWKNLRYMFMKRFGWVRTG